MREEAHLATARPACYANLQGNGCSVPTFAQPQCPWCHWRTSGFRCAPDDGMPCMPCTGCSRYWKGMQTCSHAGTCKPPSHAPSAALSSPLSRMSLPGLYHTHTGASTLTPCKDTTPCRRQSCHQSHAQPAACQAPAGDQPLSPGCNPPRLLNPEPPSSTSVPSLKPELRSHSPAHLLPWGHREAEAPQDRVRGGAVPQHQVLDLYCPRVGPGGRGSPAGDHGGCLRSKPCVLHQPLHAVHVHLRATHST